MKRSQSLEIDSSLRIAPLIATPRIFIGQQTTTSSHPHTDALS
jgi:hypothetical protein